MSHSKENADGDNDKHSISISMNDNAIDTRICDQAFEWTTKQHWGNSRLERGQSRDMTHLVGINKVHGIVANTHYYRSARVSAPGSHASPSSPVLS